MNRCFCAVLAAVGFTLTAVGQEQQSGASAPALRRICARMDAVAAAAISTNLDEAVLEAFSAFVHAVDPGGALCSPDSRRKIEASLKGIEYRLPLEIRKESNRYVVAAVETQLNPQQEIAVGDRLLSIDGISDYELTDKSLQKKLQVGRAGVTSAVELVSSRNGTTNVYELTSSAFQRPTVERIEILPRQIGYIILNGLYDDGVKQVFETFENWRSNQLVGVVLDARSASGGNLDSAVDLASWFLAEETPLFSFQSKNGGTTHYDAKNVPGASTSFPVMLLADEKTAGAAEVLVAVMKHRVQDVLLVGRETAGNPLVRKFIPFDDGQNCLYLAARELILGDTILDGQQGVIPDIAVRRNAARSLPLLEGTDAQTPDVVSEENAALQKRVGSDSILIRAVDILLGLHALGVTQD